MSFNLERFRYRRDEESAGEPASTQDRSGSASPDSDKENKPRPDTQVASRLPTKVLRQLTAKPHHSASALKMFQQTKEAGEERDTSTHTDDGETKERLLKPQELFPKRDRKQLLEVVRSTSTLDGAVVSCLMSFKDGGSSQKQKQGTPGSGDLQESDGDEQPPNKRKKRDGCVAGESDPGEDIPCWEEQETMVGRLQRAFPDLDKEELWTVLQEHNWNFDDAVEVLYLFSDPEEPSSSPEASAQKLVELKPSRGKTGPGACRTGVQQKNSSLSTWLQSGPTASPSAARKHRTTPGTSKVKAPEPECRLQRAERSNGSELEDEDSDGSKFESSSDAYDSDQGDSAAPELKARILKFFREASVDELTLISSCSLKKAQKIVDRRPYTSWHDLEEAFQKGNGLSFDLVWGCRVVLKQRQVVLSLMTKCETISSKMMRDVSLVIEKGVGSTKQPAILNSRLQLKPYQLIGLRWLSLLHQNKLSGILADEMGLGKTIQAISFLASLFQEGIEGPHLITVPSSTLDNWVRELKWWCPSLKVLVYHGSAEDRRYLRHDIRNKRVDFNVIVSTYNLTIGNEGDRSLFRSLKLRYAIFDEGHMLKNMNTLRYRHLMAINAKYRLLLTGTPLQNNLLELMSLLNFIMPSMFSSSTSQLAKMFSMKSFEEQSSFEKDRVAQAKLIIKPFILRRVKSEVLTQLPAKEDRLELCPMSERQQKLYSALLEKLRRSASSEKKELCNIMMQLRKMANHPLLHRQYYTSEKLAAMSQLMLKEPTHYDADPALIQEDMEVMSDFELHRLCQQYPTLQSHQLQMDLLLDSGKFALLTELLASLKKKGDRVVLFSQFTMMLDLVEVLLHQLGHNHVRLDGSTPIANRIVLIDQYNNDPEIFVFLLSTRAGGLGINLTSANVVILHDIDLNPYNDKQAEDRCHRVGQTRVVQVFKLVSQDTIEDSMLRVTQKKLKLEQDMTATKEGEDGDMSEDMASLLKTSLGL